MSDVAPASFSINTDFLDVLDDSKDVSLSQLLDIPTQTLVNEKLRDEDTRFAKPMTSQQLNKKMLERIPKKTRSNTKWSISVWNDWIKYRSTRFETYAEPYTLPTNLATVDLKSLDFWMSRFIIETRRKDGSPYPPNTLTQIASRIQRHLRDELNRPDVNLFMKTDPTFDNFRKAIDSRMKELTASGVGVGVKKKDPVLPQEEKAFWDKNVFNFDTADELSNAVFFYNCKAFGFRGMEEHRALDVEQFSFGKDSDSGLRYIRYVARVIKNVQGGLNHRKVEPKVITHYEEKDNERCLVKLYSLYLSLIPGKGPFYRKALPNSDKFKYPRFSAGAISEKDLSKMMVKVYKMADVDVSERNISNHSGRVTCCSTLYNSGFDDKAVTSRSWHRSSAVNTYKRELTPMLRDISNTLNPPSVQANRPPTVTVTSSPVRITDKENSAVTTSDTNCIDEQVLFIHVPEIIKNVTIVKGDKKIKVEI